MMRFYKYFPLIAFLGAGLAYFYFSIDFLKKGENLGFVIFIVCGLFFIYGAIRSLNYFDSSLDPKKGALLMQTGKKITGQIINIDHLTNIRINGRAPYVILAKAINPITHKEQIFKSYWIWEDVYYLLQNKQFVDIYIDLNNPKKYYMDLSSIS